MGYLSRKPTSNEEAGNRSPDENPWGTGDNFLALLQKTAIRCCHCACVVANKHAAVIDGHAFCPDHKTLECTTVNSDHHYSVSEFAKHNNFK